MAFGGQIEISLQQHQHRTHSHQDDLGHRRRSWVGTLSSIGIRMPRSRWKAFACFSECCGVNMIVYKSFCTMQSINENSTRLKRLKPRPNNIENG